MPKHQDPSSRSSRDLVSQSLEAEDYQDLQTVVRLLENPGFAMRLVNWLGVPIEFFIRALPYPISLGLRWMTHRALGKALWVAVLTLRKKNSIRPSKWRPRGLVLLSGVMGGFWGLPGLILELPVSTTIMLRAIAEVARSEGEDLASIEAQMACIEVFGLGGARRADDAAETGYYAIRAALAKVVSEAAEFVAERGVVQEGAPILIRLMARLTSRFGAVVSEKAMAEMLPIIGALGGGIINFLFIQHFQSMARGHFVVRRLERKYGIEKVRAEYQRIASREV